VLRHAVAHEVPPAGFQALLELLDAGGRDLRAGEQAEHQPQPLAGS